MSAFSHYRHGQQSQRDTEQQHLLADIFSDFFQNEELAIHLMRLVRLQPLEMDEMSHLFAEAGYDTQTLPGLRLVEAVVHFEAAFYEAATGNLPLQPRYKCIRGGRRRSCNERWWY